MHLKDDGLAKGAEPEVEAFERAEHAVEEIERAEHAVEMVEGATPDVEMVESAAPEVEEVMGATPDVDEVKGATPDVKEVEGAAPHVEEIEGAAPHVEMVEGHDNVPEPMEQAAVSDVTYMGEDETPYAPKGHPGGEPKWHYGCPTPRFESDQVAASFLERRALYTADSLSLAHEDLKLDVANVCLIKTNSWLIFSRVG